MLLAAKFNSESHNIAQPENGPKGYRPILQVIVVIQVSSVAVNVSTSHPSDSIYLLHCCVIPALLLHRVGISCTSSTSRGSAIQENNFCQEIGNDWGQLRTAEIFRSKGIEERDSMQGTILQHDNLNGAPPKRHPQL